MTVSGSTDFTALTAVKIVTEARSLLGIQADEEVLSDSELQRGLFWLNVMLKAWQADGVKTWTLTEGTPFLLVQGQASYVFGPAGASTVVPFDLEQLRTTRGGSDLELTSMSRRKYFALPDKTAQGSPSQYYYDRQRDTATLYFWPVPDATATTLNWTHRRRLDTVLTNGETLDLPEEWGLAIIYGLSELLIPHYGKADSPNAKLVAVSAPFYYDKVKAFDVDEGENSISILPGGYGWR